LLDELIRKFDGLWHANLLCAIMLQKVVKCNISIICAEMKSW
jgi:hypothetical protein